MDADVQILSNYKDEMFSLAFNESFMLLNRDTPFTIQLPLSLNSWIMTVMFEDVPIKHPKSSSYEIGANGIINIKCNKWYGDDWIENKEPFLLTSQDSKIKSYIKIRTKASLLQNHRAVEVNIWKKLIK